MPDLGDYRIEVLSAYGVSILLLLALVWLSWRRYAKVRAALEEVEKNG
ncbi:hemagglutination activity protein [Loktanella sp. 1ANDIMAR09]|nr:heme exporter protein CcmD [Loktanella sp. 5RATIMAR09]KQB98306.1 hemagglutination activity protein [Loktanella sp. 1ANDIMAR09]KQI72747.1 hemagglutination activity protein [Loktanella sp. 5RATIMAR09]